MPPKFTSRQLTYEAPPVPRFLQKLHSQVNSSRGNINDKRGGEASSEFDDLLGVGPSGNRQSNSVGKQNGDNSEGEDEWDGAQVVVLKEGKHLSKEEVAHSSKDSKAEPTKGDGLQGVIAGPEAAVPSSTTKRRVVGATAFSEQKASKSSGMDEAKELIASSKQTEDNNKEGGQERRKRKEEKDTKKEERNKRARIEKSKMGKGLSFSIED